jgi:sporulation protein YlmC with PRC-barrel domain
LGAVRTLTQILRLSITGPDGRSLGRPSDVIAGGSRLAPVVTGVVVGGKRLPWSSSEAPVDGDLFLVRDVLDVQVLDRQGRHRGRVGQVELKEDAAGTLHVVAVETGLRPVLNRLGLGWLARRATSDRIPWAELHPLAGRAHAFRAELPDRPRRFQGVMRARHRPPR